MEATYCVGSDVDVCRMFDQYLYKRSENVDLSLSIPNSNYQNNGYDMGDQTFHTPSFGDEEFDIPAINPNQQQQQQQHGVPADQQNMNYQPPQMNMQQMNQQQDSMGMHDPTGGYQQPLYLTGPDHGMVNPSYHSPQSNYNMSPNQQQHNNQLLMIQQQQQQQQQQAQQQAAQQHHQQQMMMGHPQQPPPGQYGTSPQHPQGRGNSPPAPGQEPTTSEDSDDSTPHPAMLTAMKRPSPEPAETIAKVQKKPKVQKKKKKRDPNEPQKPVSAYALFFRDTQAAIKGQNPNASFGEVSKIVASMWDALDSDHKNVYKKKTEAAKKEYLKALAAYRASLVSKGAGEGEGMYGGYGNYNAGAPQYAGYSPQNTIPSPPMTSAPTAPSQQNKPMVINKPPMMQQHQNMIQSPMGPVPNHMQNMPPHMQQQHSYNSMQQQQQQQQQQQVPPPAQTTVPAAQHPQQLLHMQQRASPPGAAMVSSSPPVSAPAVPTAPTSVPQQSQMRPANSCIRHGCPNPAIANAEWEDEYCSNECVVSHCRDVFSTWVATNQNQSQNFSTVK